MFDQTHRYHLPEPLPDRASGQRWQRHFIPRIPVLEGLGDSANSDHDHEGYIPRRGILVQPVESGRQ